LATFFKRATRAGKYFYTFQVAKFLVFMVHTFSNMFINLLFTMVLGNILETVITKLDISGGSLKNYVKTQWATVYDSAASVVRLETSLKEV